MVLRYCPCPICAYLLKYLHDVNRHSSDHFPQQYGVCGSFWVGVRMLANQREAWEGVCMLTNQHQVCGNPARKARHKHKGYPQIAHTSFQF